jgi:proline racemase
MNCDYLISAVDTHTGGTPTRIVHDPLLFGVPGRTMAAKQEALERDFDFIRRALILEPRGYMAMTGAIVTAPVSPGSDFGLVFMDTAGFFNLCAHALVGAATAAVELGWVRTGQREIVFDTKAGRITVSVDRRQGRATRATMQDAASFYFRDVDFELDGRTLTAEIASCGNIYALLEADDFDLSPTADQAGRWSCLALAVRDRLNQTSALLELTSGQEVQVVTFIAPPSDPSADLRTIVMFGQGQIDREPCGTCTCAKMAVLHEKGGLEMGRELVVESILSTFARALIVDRTEVEGRRAIIAQVSYQVFLTGLHRFLIDNRDPLREGYLLSA